MASEKSKDEVLACLRRSPRPLTQREISNETQYSSAQISKVMKTLVEAGQVIELDAHGRLERRYQVPSIGVTRFNERLHVNELQKSEIADRVFELVCGGSTVDDTEHDCAQTRKRLWSLAGGDVRSKLQHIHMRRERTVIIDGGTTNYCVANRIRSIALPSVQFGLWQLSVITNSPPIANSLLEPVNGPAVTVLGGRVTRDTNTITGHLAERSLTNWDVVADVSIIGTTGVDLFRGFCCQSEQESAIKAMLLCRGEIKCVTMDSSKIRASVEAHEPVTFGFAPLNKQAVDFLISDSGIWAHEQFHADLATRGITVLAAAPIPSTRTP